MSIVDLTLSSDALAIEIGRAAVRMVSELKILLPDNVYLIGNAADFDEFCVPAIHRVQPAGVSCLWPRTTKSIVFDDAFDVTFVREFIQPVPLNPEVILLQAVAGTAEEIVSMITRVLQNNKPASIRLVSCVTSNGLEERLRPYFERSYGADFSVIAPGSLDPTIDTLDFQNRAYEILDNRARKDFPNMPEWVLSQMKGHRPDPEPDEDPKPSPTLPGATPMENTPLEGTADFDQEDHEEFDQVGDIDTARQATYDPFKRRGPFG